MSLSNPFHERINHKADICMQQRYPDCICVRAVDCFSAQWDTKLPVDLSNIFSADEWVVACHLAEEYHRGKAEDQSPGFDLCCLLMAATVVGLACCIPRTVHKARAIEKHKWIVATKLMKALRGGFRTFELVVMAGANDSQHACLYMIIDPYAVQASGKMR